MAHMQMELAQDRHRSMVNDAAAQREGRRAAAYERVARRAKRAEQRRLSHADAVMRLRAVLTELESAR